MCYICKYVVRPWKLEQVGCKYCLKNFKKYLYVYTYIKLLLYIRSRYMKALVISWDHFVYAFVAKGGLQAFQQSCMSFVLWSFLNLWSTKKCSCNSELTNYQFAQIFAFNCFLNHL